MVTINTTFPITQPTPSLSSGSEYGHSIGLSLDGTIIAIGAPTWDNSGATIDTNAGIVQVYQTTDNGVSWNLMNGGELKGGNIITNPGPHQNHWGDGLHMSSDGSLVAIGGEGNVVIYEYTGSTWVQLGSEIIGPTYFSGVDTVHDLKIIGSASDKTQIYLFFGVSEHDQVFSVEYNNLTDTWEQFGNTITGDNNTDFGFSIAIYDNSFVKIGMRLMIGAYTGDDGANKSGQVYLYTFDGSNWNLTQTIGTGLSKDDQFGYSLSSSIDGNRLVIGAPADFIGTGKVYIYDWNGTLFTIATTISSPNTGIDFGHSVCLVPSVSKNLIAVGADGYSTVQANSGNIYVYREDSPNVWNSYEPFSLTDSGDSNQLLGSSVSLNETGEFLAAGGEGTSTNYPGGVVYTLQTQTEMCLTGHSHL
jgi:hypothetical protein